MPASPPSRPDPFAACDHENRAFLARIYAAHLRGGTMPPGQDRNEFYARCQLLAVPAASRAGSIGTTFTNGKGWAE